MVAELNCPEFDIRECHKYLPSVPITGITDCNCKSLYDSIHSPSSPSKLDDKRVAIDLTVIKQCVERTGLSTRWAPTELMVADALTKDQGEPTDLLRAVLQQGSYQLSSEATVLQEKKRLREIRARRKEAASSAVKPERSWQPSAVP